MPHTVPPISYVCFAAFNTPNPCNSIVVAALFLCFNSFYTQLRLFSSTIGQHWGAEVRSVVYVDFVKVSIHFSILDFRLVMYLSWFTPSTMHTSVMLYWRYWNGFSWYFCRCMFFGFKLLLKVSNQVLNETTQLKSHRNILLELLWAVLSKNISNEKGLKAQLRFSFGFIPFFIEWILAQKLDLFMFFMWMRFCTVCLCTMHVYCGAYLWGNIFDDIGVF